MLERGVYASRGHNVLCAAGLSYFAGTVLRSCSPYVVVIKASHLIHDNIREALAASTTVFSEGVLPNCNKVSLLLGPAVCVPCISFSYAPYFPSVPIRPKAVACTVI